MTFLKSLDIDLVKSIKHFFVCIIVLFSFTMLCTGSPKVAQNDMKHTVMQNKFDTANLLRPIRSPFITARFYQCNTKVRLHGITYFNKISSFNR